VSADIPAVAFGVVRMEWQVEPVGAHAVRTRHAWFGRYGSRIGIAMQTGSTIVMDIGGSPSRSVMQSVGACQ
jgi:hypothetical protein